MKRVRQILITLVTTSLIWLPLSLQAQQGSFDWAGCVNGQMQIYGWAANNGVEFCPVRVFVDDKFVMDINVANFSRPDVSNWLGGTNTMLGFYLPLPPCYADGQPHKISVCYPGGNKLPPNNVALPGGGVMTCAGTGGNCGSPAATPPFNMGSYVGVGLTNTGQNLGGAGRFNLAVNGPVLATEVQVRTGWADYVFDSAYHLPPLDTVAAHIKAKGHLPGLPSQAEVEAAGGVKLGQMQVKLLEKIEELTLYLIGIKQENQNLQAQTQNLQTQNADLQKRLEALEAKSKEK
jgi:hypothetical protein